MIRKYGSQIDSILQKLIGTREYEILCVMEDVYKDIEKKENIWQKKSNISCPDGCGSCCIGFEPDLLECEALYLAAWMIANDTERAKQICSNTYTQLRSSKDKGCILFDYDSPWHCTVYGGRCLICRLFGYTGDTGKDGGQRWKPCKFYPATLLSEHKPPLVHKQYNVKELLDLFGAIPPAMNECMEQAISISPNSSGKTSPLREALPKAINKLFWIIEANSVPDPEPQSA